MIALILINTVSHTLLQVYGALFNLDGYQRRKRGHIREIRKWTMIAY